MFSYKKSKGVILRNQFIGFVCVGWTFCCFGNQSEHFKNLSLQLKIRVWKFFCCIIGQCQTGYEVQPGSFSSFGSTFTRQR